ncbi:MAG: HAD-IIB family hydrolase, partial [Bryobacteraceae bacterium]
VSCTASGTRYIEVRPVGSDKGAALARAAELLGILREQVLAIGDSDNDVEMLRWAGVGVSVAGASAMALAGSRFVCRHAVVAGVIEVLRLIRQARRYASRLVSFKEI